MQVLTSAGACSAAQHLHRGQDSFDPGPQPLTLSQLCIAARPCSRSRQDVAVMRREYDDRDSRHDRDRSDKRREDRAGRHDRSLDKAGKNDRDRESHRRHESSDRPRDSDRDRDRHHDRPRDRHERVRDRSRERSRERLKSRDRDNERDRDPNASDRDGHNRSAPVPLYKSCRLWKVCSETYQTG